MDTTGVPERCTKLSVPSVGKKMKSLSSQQRVARSTVKSVGRSEDPREDGRSNLSLTDVFF